MTPEEILKFCKEKKIQFVDLKFNDLPGLWQHFSIPVSELTEIDDPTRNAERITLTDRRFSARFLKITYPYSESISNLYLFEVIPWGEKED